MNLASALLLTRLVVPHMLERGDGGHVVNMSSTAGKYGPAFGGVYAATKAGLIAFTQALRAEYRGRGISASVICPGFTDDGGHLRSHEGAVGPQVAARLSGRRRPTASPGPWSARSNGTGPKSSSTGPRCGR